jgi:dissimilatory sulfite reductase (desulfoviridin) alpha/beta subunit
MMAIFTLGADEIRIRKMRDIAEAWGFAGKYSDSRTLLNDARKKKFSHVLVLDYEALDDVKDELQSLGIQIVSLKDRKKLEGLIEI